MLLKPLTTLGDDNTAFQKQGAELLDQGCAVRDKTRPGPVQPDSARLQHQADYYPGRCAGPDRCREGMRHACCVPNHALADRYQPSSGL
ncbi:hypothetical protein, partial [Lichenifustis flavocetrariae]